MLKIEVQCSMFKFSCSIHKLLVSQNVKFNKMWVASVDFSKCWFIKIDIQVSMFNVQVSMFNFTVTV